MRCAVALIALLVTAEVVRGGQLLHVNKAQQAELEAIGLSPSQAAQIIRYRAEDGAFLQAEELLAVPQISRPVFDRIRPQITVEADAVPPAPQVAVDAAAAAHGVAIEQARSEWQNLYGAIVYAVSASVHNTGAAPLRAVHVRLELLDRDGTRVAQAEGYNLAAEILTTSPGKADTVKPIPPGGSDPLRLSIDKAEIARPFRSAKLTVVEVLGR